MRSLVLVSFFASLLSGCGNIYESDFDCPVGCGTPCKSLSQVNELVDNNQLPGLESDNTVIYFPESS